ncbi:undecaprenyl-diphosphate phosphatase [Conexibacter sp. SYSU D00693]|uniref:undecaprenyl-diphosphate phosphatase n=1 Tax=Conexibacter sp. SYSU D00693 TaxID=2812560 RepID=UPI00196A2BA3|nr:undecaprenyl-diphosphate phosphatase [Conexibacter sp. SYSU D00693]
MDALQAIVLGIVQGLTEFLPISSSGHLRIVPAFAGWEDPGAAFTAVVQLGTMAAELIFFRLDLWRIGTTWFASLRDPALRSTLDARMGWYLIVATIPISLLGVAFESQIDDGARNLWIIGTLLIVFALILLAVDRRAKQDKTLDQLSARQGMAIGCAQALALVPGVSRSGATITAGLLLGLDRVAAARFSFLLSIPAVVLSGLYKTKDIGGEGGAPVGATIIAVVLAFVVGYACIAGLLRFLTTHTLRAFVVYRVVLGTIVLALVGAGLIS